MYAKIRDWVVSNGKSWGLRLVLIAKKIKTKLYEHEYLLYFSVFIFFLLFSSLIYLTTPNVSSGDDQWFHFRYAQLFRTEGWSVVTNFKWLYFTNLAQDNLSYGITLYHFFLVPFTLFSNGVLGMKIAGTVMAALVPTLMFIALRKLKISMPMFWLAFLFFLASHNFVWRTYITRNYILIDGLLLLEIYLISQRKYAGLFFVALIHTWWHPATFWIAPLLAITYEAVASLHEKPVSWKNMAVPLAGSLSGFLLFPRNADHLFASMNPVGWIKTLFEFFYGVANDIGIYQGTEVYKRDLFRYLGDNKLLFFFLISIIVLEIVLYVSRKREGDDLDDDRERAILREFLFLGIIGFSFGLFVITSRFEDFMIPSLLLGIALATQFFQERGFITVNHPLIKKTVAVSLLVCFAYFFVNRALDLRNSFIITASHYEAVEKAANWLKDNSSKNEIIFNSNWDYFPILFFYNTYNRYVIGIEPKSLYRYNQKMYWLWHNISYYGVVCTDGDCKESSQEQIKDKTGDELNNILTQNAKAFAPIIQQVFKSRFVYVGGSNSILKTSIDLVPEVYEPVYSDKENKIFIYQIKNTQD